MHYYDLTVSTKKSDTFKVCGFHGNIEHLAVQAPNPIGAVDIAKSHGYFQLNACTFDGIANPDSPGYSRVFRFQSQ